MAARRILAGAQFRGAPVRPLKAAGRLQPGRNNSIGARGGAAETKTREVRQPQWPRAQAAPIAATIAACERDMPERVGPSIAITIGVRRRADADRVHDEDEGSTHKAWLIRLLACLSWHRCGRGQPAAAAEPYRRYGWRRAMPRWRQQPRLRSPRARSR